jgi:hypothetical protein
VPDEIQTGVGYRDEQFRGGSPSIDYTGPSGWIAGTWHMAPRQTVVTFDTDTRLFLLGERTAKGDSGPVSVHVEKPDAPKGILGELGDLTEKAKDKDGNVTGYTVLLILALAGMAGVVLYFANRKKAA